MASFNPIALAYTNAELRTLVEEFIYQQKQEFTFKGLCSFILYWAMDEWKTAGNGSAVREINVLEESDQDRVRLILESIVKDGRIAIAHGDDNRFEIKTYLH